MTLPDEIESLTQRYNTGELSESEYIAAVALVTSRQPELPQTDQEDNATLENLENTSSGQKVPPKKLIAGLIVVATAISLIQLARPDAPTDSDEFKELQQIEKDLERKKSVLEVQLTALNTLRESVKDYKVKVSNWTYVLSQLDSLGGS